MKPEIVTIGVYGFDETQFFQKLLNAHVEIFCDIRLRRGMRGSKYAFVNSERLQQKLHELGIKYLHIKELAPSQGIREKQHQEDEKLGVAKRDRVELGQSFIQAYKEERLSIFDFKELMEEVQDAKVVCLFCVEHEAKACHRSLVANHLMQDFSLNVEHIN